MSSRITLEIVLILLLVVGNGVFAMAEIAVVSSRKARLRARSEDGDRGAAVALELAETPNDFLSTVQVGITLVGILAGVFGGATLAKELGAHFNTVPWIAPHGETLGLAVVVLAITYLSLVIGELVPKRIGLANPERIAAAMSPAMRGLARLARPVVWFLSISTSAVVKLLRLSPSNEPSVTEEELTSMLELGRKTGEFHPAEEEMIKGVFALADRTASAIMTPRHDVIWLDLTRPTPELQRLIVESGLSRFPAAESSLDHFVGVIEVKDLIANCFSGLPPDLRAAVRQPLVFPETASALQILHEFQNKKAEIAIVVDEYGGVEGIVTVADLATRVLGLEEDENAIVVREDGSWLVDAMMNFADFAEEIGFRPGDEDEPDTVAGFVLQHLGRLPRVAESFDASGYRFEVVDMDGRRVDKVLVSRVKPDTR
ncbi:MAG TPA: hemolysin family protein [Thermoanaerobaculia bacterium]|nr:hemolysin family protein [Thermoanaerobaculia bacterium]